MRQGKTGEKSFPRFSGAAQGCWVMQSQLGSDLVCLPREVSRSYSAPVGINSGICWRCWHCRAAGGTGALLGRGSTRAGWKHHMETGSASSRKATEMTQNLFQTFVSRGRELAMSAKLNQIQTSDLVAEDLT